MEHARATDSFLKNLFPEGTEGLPFRLAVFDITGKLWYSTAYNGKTFTSPDDDAVNWNFLAEVPGWPASRAEVSGRTLEGCPWFSASTALPERHTGNIAAVAPRTTQAPTDLAALALLVRSLRQHFLAQSTLEETRIKAQFDERIIRSLSSGFVVLKPDTRILHINPAGARILGGHADDLIGRRLDSILTSKLRILDVIKTGKPIIDQEMFIQIGERSVHIIKTAVAVFDDNGKVMAVMDSFKEIKEVRRLVNHMAGSQVRYTFDDILHRSPIMAETVEMGRTAAASSLSVLITGESGTGKELLAQAIHAASSRKNAPFVVIDCASMPRDLVEGELFGYMEGAFTGALKGGRPGKFELADGGTVFLDELGELPLELQSRFLRVLQSRQVTRLGGSQSVPVDIRIIAATNRNLLEQIRTKSFRDDLYYRLNVLSIHIPPLRSRPEDILLLAEHFLQKYQIKMQRQGLSFTKEAVDVMLRSPWPGNARELENTVARAVQVCGKEVRPEDLSPEHYAPRPEFSAPPPPPTAEHGQRPPVPDLVTAPQMPDLPVLSGWSGLSGWPAPGATNAQTGLPDSWDRDEGGYSAETAQRQGAATLKELQADFYLSTLKRCNGNIAEAARFLGVARSTVYKKMRALGLDANTVCSGLRGRPNT